MAVTLLFTNIPHQDGIQACEEVWEERKVKDPPTQTLVKLLTLMLKCNNFEFNGKHYLQVQGTAMGTKMAPAYANSSMDRLQEHLLRSMVLRPFSWLRFIGDIDMKWSHGQETLTTFLGEANNFHPSIKFTAEISTKQHVFLDTKSSFAGDTKSVDLYTKKNNKKTNCHPKYYRKTVPYIYTALHFASNVSAPIRTLLNQEQEN